MSPGFNVAIVLHSAILLVLGVAFVYQGVLSLRGAGTLAGVLGDYIRPTGVGRYLFGGSLLFVGIASILLVINRVIHITFGRENKVELWVAISFATSLFLGCALAIVYFIFRVLR